MTTPGPSGAARRDASTPAAAVSTRGAPPNPKADAASTGGRKSSGRKLSEKSRPFWVLKEERSSRQGVADEAPPAADETT